MTWAGQKDLECGGELALVQIDFSATFDMSVMLGCCISYKLLVLVAQYCEWFMIF